MDGAGMIHELLEFGFDRIELGHGIRLSLMHGIQKVFDKGRVQFSSLHNFCPLPVEITRASPDCLQFSSHRDMERERAVKQTFLTIDFAQRLGAPFVVLHCGRVNMQPITAQLIDMAANGQHLTQKYAGEKVKAVQRREEIAPKYLARTKDCLKRIVEYAESKGVKLGIEGRQAYEEIPTEREAWDLLEEFKSPNVGYWHDFGHIQIKHNLGFVDHVEWITKVRSRLFGCHLHDVLWPGLDHRAPFTGGSVEYDKLVPLLHKDCLFVWEMSPRRKREEIIESLKQWKERFGA
jgi:sugar phosphate isomerase/epimerase